MADETKNDTIIFQRTGGAKHHLTVDQKGNSVKDYTTVVNGQGTTLCTLDAAKAHILIENAYDRSNGSPLFSIGYLTGRSEFTAPEGFIPNLCTTAKAPDTKVTKR